jgi:hypothetical protein
METAKGLLEYSVRAVKIRELTVKLIILNIEISKMALLLGLN